ncbi:hypothetical protein [Nonomuraea sp. 10N515B]|uniref:hypothetical protein n=1 Tax=Nonomuraea sp. 10N515B TaxID=3457422 RepID=UPI003FCD4225
MSHQYGPRKDHLRAASHRPGHRQGVAIRLRVLRRGTAVLALTKATHDKPWFYTARVVLETGSALELLNGGGRSSRDEDDRAHAAAVAARVQPGDLVWGRERSVTL